MTMRKTSVLMMVMLAGWMAGSSVAHADALCPDTGKSSDLAIGNVSDLQFDIDRLGLCVQRARLLQQIDEAVKKREDLRMQPFGVSGSMGAGMGANNNVMIPAMPMPPELPALSKATSSAPAMAQPVAAAPPAGEWKIQRIWGQGDGMQAQLVKDDVIANIKLNDILPSGERVSVLSARGITLDNGKTAKQLQWLENTKKDNSAALAGKRS